MAEKIATVVPMTGPKAPAAEADTPDFFDNIAISRKIFGANPRSFTNKKALDFFNAYVQHGILTKACQIVGVSPKTIYDNAERHPRFAEALALAKRMAIEKLEAEAHRRAVEGVEEPVYYQGAEVGTVRKYSDRLLELLLEANKPGKFGREKRSGGTPDGGASSTMPQVIIQNFGDGKVLAVIQNQTPEHGKEPDVKNNSPVQVETPDLSTPRLELS